MKWERTPHRSAFYGERFYLECDERFTGWTAMILMRSDRGARAFVVAPTLSGSTRDEAETAAICAARELSAELALMARKASLP